MLQHKRKGTRGGKEGGEEGRGAEYGHTTSSDHPLPQIPEQQPVPQDFRLHNNLHIPIPSYDHGHPISSDRAHPFSALLQYYHFKRAMLSAGLTVLQSFGWSSAISA